jgi:hypothetical protein
MTNDENNNTNNNVMPSVATISNVDAGIYCNIQITSSVRVRTSDTGKIVEIATSQLYDSTLI